MVRNEKKRICCLLLTLYFNMGFWWPVFSQVTTGPLESVVDKEQWEAGNANEVIDLSAYVDYEEDLLNNPVNLAEINPLELLRLRILNREEIDALYEYLLAYGPMVSNYELSMVEGLGAERIERLSRYVCINSARQSFPSPGELLRSLKLEMIMTGKIVPETKAGYSDDSATITAAQRYQGDPWQERISLRASLGRSVAVGLGLKKDPGENAPSLQQPFQFDDRSFFLSVNNVGWIRKIVVGRFGISVGQGLTLGCGSGLGLGRETDLRFQSRGLFPSLSFSRSSSFNGIATTVKSGTVSLSLFYSCQKRDATSVDNDSLSEQIAYTSILDGGYHRTMAEMEKKDKVTEKDAGVYLVKSGEKWKSGITVLYHGLDAKKALDPTPYRYYSDKGNDHLWFGWDCVAFLNKITVFQEVSQQYNGNMAWVGGTSFTPAALLKASLIINVLPGLWINPHAGLVSTAAAGAKETSVSIVLQAQINHQSELILSTENDRYGWLRYRTSSPGDKSVYHIIYNIRPSKNALLEFYAKIGKDQYNQQVEKKTDSIITLSRLSLGITCKYSSPESYSFRMAFRMISNDKPLSGNKTGYLITQDISGWLLKKKVKLGCHLAFFETDTYDERLYAWEEDIYRGFSIPAYYYRGTQVSGVLSCRINRWVNTCLKYSVFRYPGKVSIGTGAEQISGNKKSEISLQLRLNIR